MIVFLRVRPVKVVHDTQNHIHLKEDIKKRAGKPLGGEALEVKDV